MSRMLRFAAFVTFLALAALAALAGERAGPVHVVNGKLTLDEAVQIALKQNPNILKALQQIEVTRGQIIEVRAEALPHVALTGDYSQEQRTLLQGGSLGVQTQNA